MKGFHHEPMNFTVEANKIDLFDKENKESKGKRNTKEGIELNTEQANFLLPHFFLIVVGKPGSGKTTIVKQMLS